MKYIVALLMSLYLLLTSCCIRHNAINSRYLGAYIISNVSGYESITILSDSTFSYSWYNNPMKYQGETKGKIKTINRNHFLNNQDEYIKSDTMPNLDSEVIKIIILDKNGKEPLIGCECTSSLNGQIVESKSSGIDGTCLLYNTNVNKVKIENTGYQKIEIDLNQYMSNSFEVYLDEMSQSFIDYQIKFKEGEIWLYQNTYLKKYTKIEKMHR